MWTRALIPLVLLIACVALDPGTAAGQSRLDFLSARPAVGELAPSFSLWTLDGTVFRLRHEYRQRPVVIMFGSYT